MDSNHNSKTYDHLSLSDIVLHLKRTNTRFYKFAKQLSELFHRHKSGILRLCIADALWTLCALVKKYGNVTAVASHVLERVYGTGLSASERGDAFIKNLTVFCYLANVHIACFQTLMDDLLIRTYEGNIVWQVWQEKCKQYDRSFENACKMLVCRT